MLSFFMLRKKGLITFVLFFLWFVSTSCNRESRHEEDQIIKHYIGKAPLKFTKHALCRMWCRHIDAQEIAAILKLGKINYYKSDTTNKNPCRKKYAVEGGTQDGQQVRVVVAPCNNQLTVITVIDLGVNWKCDCH